MKTFFTGVFGFLLGTGMTYIILHDPDNTSPFLKKKLTESSFRISPTFTLTSRNTQTVECKSCGGHTITEEKSELSKSIHQILKQK